MKNKALIHSLNPRFIVGADRKPESVIINYNQFKKLIDMLEDLDDERAAQKALKIAKGNKKEDYIPGDLANAMERTNPFKAAREYYRLTLDEVAEKSGLNRQHIHMMETGKRHPKHDTIKKLAAVFKLSPDFFE